MQNRLLLTLWLAGGLLYAGSTIFLANTLLGGRPTDKAMTIAANEKANCAKDSVAAANADETKTAALAPSKDAPAEAPAPAPAKPEVAPPTEPEANAARPGESAEPGVERQTDPSEHAATEPVDGGYDARAPYDRNQGGYDAPAPYDRGDQGAYAPAP
jgi:predicted lipid-binding transport protein (Tim44 family)